MLETTGIHAWHSSALPLRTTCYLHDRRQPRQDCRVCVRIQIPMPRKTHSWPRHRREPALAVGNASWHCVAVTAVRDPFPAPPLPLRPLRADSPVQETRALPIVWGVSTLWRQQRRVEFPNLQILTISLLPIHAHNITSAGKMYKCATYRTSYLSSCSRDIA